ncbi:Phosphatidylserine decarboxylase-related protein [Penicillium hispanicum]|uniref:Phosphatidylserine decarboxylase-related protein n=1 Tax=Penicillium hispanicum TaxID=1080232 RepID=UPI00254057D0|nr:Phosphatidylserine decarboxylase-related protein [Penicillium hispanicum]KAJ5594009.1 Phosphatidylserine decarboxylase-related protein [Penicillium hispanicum]
MVRLPLPQRLSSHLSARSTSSTPGQSRSTSPMRPVDPKPLLLKVTVIRGRDLAAKDRGGTSDPYLVVTLGDARQSTPTIFKTLNPEWNVSFEMPLGGVPLLECICWDHDRFGKDYLGEFDIALEDIFPEGQVTQEPKWYTLKSNRSPARQTKKKKKKDNNVSGEILLQFSISDSANPGAPPSDTYRKFKSLVCSGEEDDQIEIPPTDLDDLDRDETSDETDDPSKPEVIEKRKRRLRLARLRRKSLAARAYQFSGSGTGVQGIVFMEVVRVTDLPPERNVTRTSFDMDPFVVTSLGRKTLRTPVIRHNLNPIYHEKMVFQVMRHEQTYTISFTVMDRDKFSGNDFVASAGFPLQNLIQSAPEADPESGLYDFVESDEANIVSKSSRGVAISPSASSQSLSKMGRPTLKSRNSAASLSTQSALENLNRLPPSSVPEESPEAESGSTLQVPSVSTTMYDTDQIPPADEDGLRTYTIPLTLKNRERWEDKHSPELHVKAKYLPYSALRQQFWRLMLKQYDADDSGRIDKIEMTTMLDTLGSTLKESTIDGFFTRFSVENEPSETVDLTFDQAVICLEDTLQALQKKSAAAPALPRPGLGPSSVGSQESEEPSSGDELALESSDTKPANTDPTRTAVPTISSEDQTSSNEEDLRPDDLVDERGEEHVVEIRECPLCHQPRLGKRSDADIITHIATCASRDWRQVDNLVMGGFVTSSQAQRKWYSKVITKISYGGYRLGANSANILVQDRITGQINEERMSVYVRLGIRLLYKGLKSKDMEKKRIRRVLRSLSIKQGRKYDDPASASQIRDFINFHQLDMTEVLLPVEKFRNFNEFFYRALKPEARPCSAPDEPRIVVSPADCRSVVFDRMDNATSIWVKGREFSVERLLGNAYPEDAPRYRNGALGVFRLAPQDYHRFHVPVDGIMGEPKTIEGEYYTVNPMAIRSALDVYGENVRILVPIDSVAHGRVMVVCVGAMMVGSTVITRKAGEKVSRAEELGYFKFGGSTLLVLFEEGMVNFDTDLADNSRGPLETLVTTPVFLLPLLSCRLPIILTFSSTQIRVGMSVGHSPEIPQFEPDMPKKEENITAEEKQEAKRRIAGSLAPPSDQSALSSIH